MFNINPLKFLTRTRTIVVEAYKGASKMGKGKKLNSQEITTDLKKSFYAKSAENPSKKSNAW